jgi:dUTP pyrophosphatase
MKLEIKRLNGNDLPLPSYETHKSSGMDLKACITENIVIKPGERKLIGTGIAIALPENFEAQVRPRSGLALKNGITVLNTPGTIDADYRGEIGVILINLSNIDFIIERGMRIAQMIVIPMVQAEIFEVKELDKTKRGEGGFGSTGI